MNLWIDLDLNGLWEVIKLTNIFLLNDEEAMQLTGKKDLHEIGKQLLESGPDTVIIKKGANGSTLFSSNGIIEMPVYDQIELFDPTGAGDSFAGGLVGYISKYGEKNIEDALIHATATASFTVSDFGVTGLTTSSEESFESRCKYIKSKL